MTWARGPSRLVLASLLLSGLLLFSGAGVTHPDALPVQDIQDAPEEVEAVPGPDGSTEDPLERALDDRGLVSVPGRAPRPIAAAHGNGIEFECPEATRDGATGTLGSGSFTFYGCPLRIYDAIAPGVRGLRLEGEDVGTTVGWLFGNVQLSVVAEDPSQAAFFSLHGNPAEEGRVDNARDDLTHTTFTTQNQGLAWADQPTQGGTAPSSNAVGEWASGTLDSQGRIYPAFLWNTVIGGGNHESVIGVFSAETPATSGSVEQSYFNGSFIRSRTDESVIELAHIVYVPPEDDGPEPANTTEPQQPGELGEAALVRNETDLVSVVWFERVGDVKKSPTNLSGWIDAGWHSTDPPPGRDANWTTLAESELIGPCRNMSDPVVWDQEIYVACVVERGYDARLRANVGDVDIWRIDPRSGESELVGFTGIPKGDHVRLTATPDGYFAVASSRVIEENQVDVRVSLGWHAKHWGMRNVNLGAWLHQQLGEVPLRDAHVTALALTEDQKTLYLTYKEWNNIDGPVLRPELEMPRLKDYKKMIVSMNECTVPLGAAEFHMGEIFDSHQYETWEDSPAIFNDRQDGLQYVRMPDGRERVFMAVNDYGAVQYAAIAPAPLGENFECNVPPPPQALPVAAIPAAVGTGTGAGTAVGSAVGLVSLAMITYLLTVKRKSPLAAAAKDE